MDKLLAEKVDTGKIYLFIDLLAFLIFSLIISSGIPMDSGEEL
jgi:hypothetical protein